MEAHQKITELLTGLYGSEAGPETARAIETLLRPFENKTYRAGAPFSEKDVFLITYGDSLKQSDENPLRTLGCFTSQELRDCISHVHILPFFPYSSDDGFSVLDYMKVDPQLGTWENVRQIGEEFGMMFDLVLNHVSARSEWFRAYLSGDADFAGLAIAVDPKTDLSQVVRPRTHPLLTPFTRNDGSRVSLWTTFSADQIDLNYANPRVLLLMIKVMLHYVRQGATVLRLDAIAYLWKRIGTPCIHLKETHDVVRLLRLVFQAACPGGMILTETNVPHKENISYFGNGYDEAQVVYNFTLPPLLLHTFLKGNVTLFNAWVQTLSTPSQETTFFNFTASHDGIGVRPLEGIVPDEDMAALVNHVKQQGGHVSSRTRSDGSESPYELNVTYVDAMKKGAGPDPLHIRRFLASQAVALMLPGIPAVYIHSLLGSRNWTEGVNQTRRSRTINREKLEFDRIHREWTEPGSFRRQVYTAYKQMLGLRRRHPAFHPNADFKVWNLDPRLFVMQRSCQTESLLGLVNVSDEKVTASFNKMNLPSVMRNLLSQKRYQMEDVTVHPYEILWLKGE